MDLRNETVVTEFILIGLSSNPKTQVILFVIFLLGYLIILTGNILIIGLILTDTNLQTPMYFFLLNLSFLDICFSTTTVPRMLRDLMSVKKIITYAECATQLYICLSLGEIECILLAVMAYNRYVAICYPLHYTTIMSRMACVRIAVSTWICGFLLSISHVAVVLSVGFCGNNEINDFLCEVPELLSISCENDNTIFIEGITYVVGVIVLMIPVTFIVVSYIKIISSILKITSLAGRSKAFSTCGSHITVVIMFYGSVMTAYMKPRSSLTPETDKVNTVFYCVATPMFNPIIYTLRNNDVKSAFLKFRNRHSSC
ncbi:olfactory receptor 2D2-like [Aquarana catesbeiana]|uniref:olfactory receptor 2D2-like n=1 Tax=Aquarana catesbeiana TaxID=8400 RepID=UPI003CC9F69D